MKPEAGTVLEILTGQIVMQFAPKLPEGYPQSALGLSAGVLGMVREEYERAAARRVEENDALRELFANALDAVQDEALAAELGEASRGTDDSLLVADLERANDALREQLIRLQAHVEELEGDAARRVEEAIWRELVTSTERRKLSLGPF